MFHARHAQPNIKYSFDTFDILRLHEYVKDWHESYAPSFGTIAPEDFIGVLRLVWEYMGTFLMAM